MALQKVQEKVLSGKRLTEEEALLLYDSDEIHQIGILADHMKGRISGEYVYFILNRHINPTNICVNRCGFCAFSRSPGEEGAYELTTEQILQKIQEAREPIREVHIVGGLHPFWTLEHYTGMLSTIKEHFPHIRIKAFTAVEVDHISRVSGLEVGDVLRALKDAGLDLMPGGGAEIIDPEVRRALCPEKISGQRWLQIHRTAHRLGIKTNATMLYGHIESHIHRIRHLAALRRLQDETGGFQAFIPLRYHPTKDGSRSYPGIEDLKTIAISRLFLDNFPHIKAYWVMLGEKLSQVALLFGADDLEGTVIEERITHSTGSQGPEYLSREDLLYLIQKAGKVPVERDSFYNPIRVYHEEVGQTRGVGTVH